MRYIHGDWDHLFGSRRTPTDLRICFDLKKNQLVAMEVQQGSGFTAASQDEIADVEDSLKNSNDDALVAPQAYGLEASNTLPDWTKAYVQESDDQPQAGEDEFDNTQALSEGWDLFEVEGRIQLQRIDDPASSDLDYTVPKFASDADALIQVAFRARAGSAYHRDAIERIGTLAGDTVQKTKFNEIAQVVVFASGGITQSVAVRALPRGDVPCIVVDYDDRHDDAGDLSPEDFERKKLGISREQFDKTAVYIW